MPTAPPRGCNKTLKEVKNVKVERGPELAARLRKLRETDRNVSSGHDHVSGEYGIEMVFITTISMTYEWQGTVITSRYDEYGNLLQRYVSDLVLTSSVYNPQIGASKGTRCAAITSGAARLSRKSTRGWGGWAKETGVGCGAAAGACGLASAIFAGTTFGPCFVTGCTAMALRAAGTRIFRLN